MTLLSRFPALGVLLLAFGASGCLPSCQKRADKSLLPADSTSRRLAATIRADTLATLWTKGPDAGGPALRFPRTVRFSTSGDTVWIADGQANRLVAFDTAGTVLQTVAGAFRLPFLAGFRGDTVVVFSAGAHRFDLVAGGRIVRQVAVALPKDRSLVRYAHAVRGGYAVKAGGRDTDAFLVVVDEAGRERRRTALPGPLWRHAGLLRTARSDGRADTLVSLVGFAPVVDHVDVASLRRDTLALVGFDSPKLDQRRRYLTGESDAPLLASSAAPLPGGRLFVANLRPGWLQVDVYDRGRLAHRLLDQREALDFDYLVEDLDVRPSGAGYLVATVQAKPQPRLTLYRWDR